MDAHSHHTYKLTTKLPLQITVPHVASNDKLINPSVSIKTFNIQYVLKLQLIKPIAQFKSLKTRFISKSQSYS